MNALLNEDTDNLVKKFGGLEKLEFSINSGQEQITNFIGVNNEFYHEEPGTLWGSFKALKEFFEMILAENIPFKTYIGKFCNRKIHLGT